MHSRYVKTTRRQIQRVPAVRFPVARLAAPSGRTDDSGEALGKYIEEELAEDIMTTLQTLMRSPDTKNKVLGVELACKVLNYFKPKFQNTTNDIKITGDPIYIIEAKDYEEGNLN